MPFFQINTLKDIGISVTVVILELNTLIGTKALILTLKRYDDYTRPFYMDVPPGKHSMYSELA